MILLTDSEFSLNIVVICNNLRFGDQLATIYSQA